MLCFGNFTVAKKFLVKSGGGVSIISVKSFLSHVAENFRRGTYIRLKKFSYRKPLEFKEGAEITNFRR